MTEREYREHMARHMDERIAEQNATVATTGKTAKLTVAPYNNRFHGANGKVNGRSK